MRPAVRGRDGRMRPLRRMLCLLLVVSALTAACGDDEEETPTTNPTTTTVATASSVPSTTVPATIAQGVTDGAICPTPGARGMTQGGIAVVCVPIAGGNETRWRPA